MEKHCDHCGTPACICAHKLSSEKKRLKNPKGGLTAAGREHYKRTEGANLKPGVRQGSGAKSTEAKRRWAKWAVRFYSNPRGPMVNDKGEPTRLALMANAWGTKVPKTREEAQAIAARGRKILESTKKSSVDPSVVLQEHDKMPRSYMAYSNLHNVQEDAGQLEHLMNPQDDLPQWADQMLARAQDNVADVLDYVRSEKSADEAPWENPKEPTGKKLTDAQKEKAKRKAKAAGRPYPNLVDNMNVAKKEAFDVEASAFDRGSQLAFSAFFGRAD